MTTTIIDNEFVTLWYHPEKKIVHHQFHKFIWGQAFRDALNEGTKLLQQYGTQKWLSDNRNRGPLTEEDMKWTQTDWFPRTVNAGWKYWALVMPDAVIAQMNMKRAVRSYAEQGITVRIFEDTDEAFKWLESI